MKLVCNSGTFFYHYVHGLVRSLSTYPADLGRLPALSAYFASYGVDLELDLTITLLPDVFCYQNMLPKLPFKQFK